LLFYCVIRKFLGVFSGDLGFSIVVHIGIRYQFLHFSECWLVGPLQSPVGSLQLSFTPWLKPPATPLVTSH